MDGPILHPTMPVVPDDYLESVVAELHAHRPELLRRTLGRWVGPVLHPQVAGLLFQGLAMTVIVSPWDTDGGPWLHVSVSRRDRCPDYDELTEVINRFFRETDTVLHVWPPKTEHYSLHPYCLHLWTPMDGSRPIPDLRGNGGGV